MVSVHTPRFPRSLQRFDPLERTTLQETGESCKKKYE